MKKSKETISGISGGIIILCAAGYLFFPTVVPWIMILAVLVFSYTIVTTPYPGKSIRGKRLFNFQILACVFFVVTAYLMFRQRNEWVLPLLIGTVFYYYASVIMPKEFKKEQKQ